MLDQRWLVGDGSWSRSRGVAAGDDGSADAQSENLYALVPALEQQTARERCRRECPDSCFTSVHLGALLACGCPVINRLSSRPKRPLGL